jgi:hypothetical protein
MVNNCGFARHFDFKRAFEDLGRVQSPNPAAFNLTRADTMLINRALSRKGQRARKAKDVRTFISLIVVSKRTAGGG